MSCAVRSQPVTRWPTMAGPAVTYTSVLDLTNALRAEIHNSTHHDPQHICAIQLTLGPSALVPLERPKRGPYSKGGAQDLPAEFRTEELAPTTAEEQEHGTRSVGTAPFATVEAICGIKHADHRMIVQRAASRGIKDAIEAVDGHRYILNNFWPAGRLKGEDIDHRSSYICLDSMQNKDRSVNGGSKVMKRVMTQGRFEARKPTYDCKGNVSIKVNSQSRTMVVVYKHIPLHLTVAERKGKPLSSVLMPSDMELTEQGFTGALRAELQSWSASSEPPADSIPATREAHAPPSDMR